MASRTRSTALALAALATVLAGCGDDSSAQESTDPASEDTGTASSGLPACAEVWQEDTDLPADYAGCDDGGTEVAAEVVDCSSGQRVVTYADEYWAVPGHVIARAASPGLTDDPGYQADMASCRA